MNNTRVKVVFTDYDFADIDIEKEVLSQIDCEIIEANTQDENKLIEVCHDADALIIQYAPITQKVTNSLKNCKVFSRYGIGVDTIDVAAATEQGIYVCNVPDYCLDEVADHCLALMLSLGRKIVNLSQSVRQGVWDTIHISKPLYNFKNQILSLIGFGKIPQNLYSKAAPLFKEILVFDPYLKPENILKYDLKLASFYEVLRYSDYISIHCPSNESTFHMFDIREFQLMKPTSYIVNTSRGAIINTAALYQALTSGLIAGAGLDVLEKEPPGMDFELLKLENVLITPHSAFYSETSIKDLKYKTALNVLKVLKGEEAINVLNK
jgi:D-3-phosphoglycerate dehydrogenase / 2-oxoglutarate reductase